MLAYAYHSLNQSEHDQISAEEFDHLHDLFAAILARGIMNQVKRGLHREYKRYEDVFSNLRGKINPSLSIKQQTLLSNQMVCEFDELTENTILNRITKSTVLLLLKHGQIKNENKVLLKKSLLLLANVETVDLKRIQWQAIRYNRNNDTYRIVINMCYMVAESLLFSEESGNLRLRHYIDDQKMQRLFEKFVLNYYHHNHHELIAKAGFIDWNVDDGFVDLLPRMKTDVILKSPNKTLIIDTKYYGRTLQKTPYSDTRTIISGNLYQIYSYVKNYDSESTGNVSGMLLYAKTDELLVPDNDYSIGGNKISVKTLDLDEDWNSICEQLESYVLLLR